MALPPPEPDSTALVTGASSGIGEEIARGLARRGHGVTLVARREDRLTALAGELGRAHDVRTEVIGADLADPAARDELAARVGELGLDVEVLVNNAGYGGFGPFAEQDREREIGMIRLNVEALVDLESRFLPGMVGRERGAVVNIASTASFQPIPDNATYAATKAFVLSHGEAVHEELRGSGVSVTTVCPGPVKTEFADVAGIGGAEDRTPEFVWLTPEQVATAAIDGAERGRRVVVPGMLNRATSLVGQHSPRAIALPLTKNIWRRGAL
ncbi:MAG TPA: SDR family oxidoreductase [Solirubrobacterales bacterium]